MNAFEAPGASRSETVAAAQYIRMSDDQKQYSTAYQAAAIAAYAAAQGIKVVRTYVDEGRSGLVLRGRSGLQALLRDVLEGSPGYRMILVYDVSRWGRYQDVDEAGHYEFLCKRAGAPVVYCAEPFDDDGSALNALYKTMKRAMAADHSRELSERISRAKRIAASKGAPHGRPPYGYRRQLLARDGSPIRMLGEGETKYAHSQRIRFVPGPANEVEIVQNVFRWFVDGCSMTTIASRLNSSGAPSPAGGAWALAAIRRTLRNEIYVGTLVYGRVTLKLKTPVRQVPADEWVRVEDAFEPLVPKELFDAAGRRLASNSQPLSADQIKDRLMALCEREGRISRRLVADASDVPSIATIYRRIGGAGFRALKDIRPTGGRSLDRVTALMERLEREAFAALLNAASDEFTIRAMLAPMTALIDDSLRVRVHAARPTVRSTGEWIWRTTLPDRVRGEWNLVIRSDVDTDQVLDYLLVPRRSSCLNSAVLERDVPPELRAYQHSTMGSVLSALPFLSRWRTEGTHGGPGKYLPLRKFLERQTEDVIELSLAEIVQVIGADLPPGAATADWWTNGKPEWSRRYQARAWMAAGFVAHFHPRKGVVRFVRSACLSL